MLGTEAYRPAKYNWVAGSKLREIRFGARTEATIRVFGLHQFPDGKLYPRMFKPQPAMWYVVVTCEKCKSTVFLFPDLTEGKSSLDASYIVTCPRCSHKGSYSAHHYYHAQSDGGPSGDLSSGDLSSGDLSPQNA